MQSWSAILVFALYVLIPLYSLVNLLYNFKLVNRHEDEHFARYGMLYKGLKISHGRWVLLEPLSFLVRRIFLPVLIIYGPKVLIWQMISIIGSNLLVMIITFTTKSIASASERRLQTFAEIST